MKFDLAGDSVMFTNFNTITSNFNINKVPLSIGVNQCYYQALRTCKATVKVSSLCLKKLVKALFLAKELFIKRTAINDSLFLVQQEVILDSFKGPNPLIEDVSQNFKEIGIFYKKINSAFGDLAEKTADQISCLLEKTINQKISIESFPYLDQIGFGKLLDSSLWITQKFFPQEFLNLTNRNKKERKIIEKLESLLACLQHFEIPYFKLAKAFISSDVESITKQLKFIDEGIQAFIEKKTDLSGDECCMLVNALESISELQNLLEEYQKNINKPIEEEDRIFAKEIIKKNPLVIKIVPPTIIALGSIIVASSYTAIVNSNEEKQEEYSLYMISNLLNQVTINTFAYMGVRICGSKMKVKEFVEQKISNILAYEACSSGLEYLGVSFWPNKVVSAIVSDLTNHILH